MGPPPTPPSTAVSKLTSLGAGGGALRTPGRVASGASAAGCKGLGASVLLLTRSSGGGLSRAPRAGAPPCPPTGACCALILAKTAAAECGEEGWDPLPTVAPPCPGGGPTLESARALSAAARLTASSSCVLPEGVRGGPISRARAWSGEPGGSVSADCSCRGKPPPAVKGREGDVADAMRCSCSEYVWGGAASTRGGVVLRSRCVCLGTAGGAGGGVPAVPSTCSDICVPSAGSWCVPCSLFCPCGALGCGCLGGGGLGGLSEEEAVRWGRGAPAELLLATGLGWPVLAPAGTPPMRSGAGAGWGAAA